MYVDSHTHIDITQKRLKIDGRRILTESSNNNIKYIMQVAIDAENLKWSRKFVNSNLDFKGLYFAGGIHPSNHADIKELEKLASEIDDIVKYNSDRFVGIGECGLDFYRMHQAKEMQIEAFRFQIELAKKHNLPLIIHSRNAMEETFDILIEHRPLWGIMHCFPGDVRAAKIALNQDFYISYAGNLTYKNATELHESAKYVPMDRLLTETDAPYLTPIPFRGKANKPHYVKHTCEFLADLKKVNRKKMASAIENNFEQILKRAGCLPIS